MNYSREAGRRAAHRSDDCGLQMQIKKLLKSLRKPVAEFELLKGNTRGRPASGS
jgi:hypothetical protein